MKKFSLLFVLLFSTTFALASNGGAYESNVEIPYPFYDVQSQSMGQDNKITLLESGITALYKRLEIIESATEHIEVEYFVYDTDNAAKLLTQALVDAARRGVRVRMLVDASFTVLELQKYHAKLFEEAGIEIKFYNTSAWYRISSIQFRNHRKLLSVDDKIAITGGRNVKNDYYDLSHEYNFLDRDIVVEGPIVFTMRESFDRYFDHRISKTFDSPERPADTRMQRVRRNGYWRSVRRDNSRNVRKYEERMARGR